MCLIHIHAALYSAVSQRTSSIQNDPVLKIHAIINHLFCIDQLVEMIPMCVKFASVYMYVSVFLVQHYY